jgi:signal peptidase II
MRSVLITIFSVLFIDQFTKLWVKTNSFLGEEIGGAGFIKFQFIENPGMAFGMEFGGVWGKIGLSLFRVGAVVAIWFIIKNLLNNKAHQGLVFSVGLIFAGALGNIFDSAFYGMMFNSGTHWDSELLRWVGYYDVSQLDFQGYSGFFQGCVVDMIHFEFHYPSWMPFGLDQDAYGNPREIFPPVFNIADFAISFGVGVIIVFNKRFLGKGKGDFSVFRKQPEVEKDSGDLADE